MSTVDLLLSVTSLLLSPWLYLATGGVLDLLRAARSRSEPATMPLRGVVFWGLVGMAHIVAGGSRLVVEAAGVLLLAGVSVWRRDQMPETFKAWRGYRSVWWVAYGFFAVVLTIAPFPGMWLMGGDWLSHFNMAWAVYQGTFGSVPDHLARCPLFAAGAMPILGCGPALASFQIFNAVAAAASWLPIVARTLEPGQPRTVRLLAWAAFAISPVVTVVVTNLWPKFLAGGCLVLALYRIASWREHGRLGSLIAAGAWLSFAIMAHESCVLYIPLFLIIASCSPSGVIPGARWGRLVLLLGGSAAIVGFWEGWTVWKFGWAARVAANPAVLFALDVPLWKKSLLVLNETLWASTLTDLAVFWRHSALGWRENTYYSIVTVISSLGATMVGIWTFWVLALGREWWRRAWAHLQSTYGRWVMSGVCAALLIHSVLLGGIGIRFGAVQCGLIPLVMWTAGGVIGGLRASQWERVRRVLFGWALLGWAPYLAASIAVGIVLNWRYHFGGRAADLASHDGDLYTLLSLRFQTLGLNPALWCAAVVAATAGAIFMLVLVVRWNPRNGEPQASTSARQMADSRVSL